MRVFGSDEGRGLFRFDNALLEDEEFVSGARVEIEKAKNSQGIYGDVVDLGLKIEMLSSEIRVQSMRISKQRKKQSKKDAQMLMAELELLEEELGRNPTEQSINRYREVKNRLDREEEKRGRLAIHRSGARWLEMGEKPTKYFFRLIAKRKKEKEMHVLQRSNGEYVTGNNDILEYCRKHYEEMYSSKLSGMRGVEVANFLTSVVLPRLSQIDRERCEGRITYEECEVALKEMMNNKAASVSGFSKEFFLFFWNEIGPMVVDYINQAREKGIFFHHTTTRSAYNIAQKRGPKIY